MPPARARALTVVGQPRNAAMASAPRVRPMQHYPPIRCAAPRAQNGTSHTHPHRFGARCFHQLFCSDAAEMCDGVSSSCPTDQFRSASAICRVAATPCDTAEFCSGANANCPPDQLRSSPLRARPHTPRFVCRLSLQIGASRTGLHHGAAEHLLWRDADAGRLSAVVLEQRRVQRAGACQVRLQLGDRLR